MRLSQGFDSRRGFNEADFWMGSISMPAWRMWVRTKRIHLIGPALPGGSCFEDLSPADLVWDGGGWARQQECQEEVLFRYPTYEHTEMRHLSKPNDAAARQQATGSRRRRKCSQPQLILEVESTVFTFTWKKKYSISRFEVIRHDATGDSFSNTQHIYNPVQPVHFFPLCPNLTRSSGEQCVPWFSAFIGVVVQTWSRC